MNVRITRFRRLACGGRSVCRLYRAGGLPAVTYGMRVHGAPDAQLASLRATAAFAIFGPPRGRSRTVEFMLSDDPKCDPTYDANALPLVTWLKAFWLGWATPNQMKMAHSYA
eukprot:7338125-Pyramimonas_sp.AAC.1